MNFDKKIKINKGNNIELTVALPCYNSNKIAWLALESLCNQTGIGFEWELIICEEVHDNMLGESWVDDYIERLIKINCLKVTYVQLEKWVNLPKKWQIMGKLSDDNSKVFLLHASDCYSPKNRLSLTYDKIVKDNFDWVDFIKGYFYSFISDNIVLYNSKLNNKKKALTNLNMAFKTIYSRNIPNTDINKSIDGFLYNHCKKSNKKFKYFNFDILLEDSLDTNGYNNISVKREQKMLDIIWPFENVDRKIENLDLPRYIINKIIKLKINNDNINEENIIINKIKNINSPTTNEYYEKSSADGYAFLGCAYNNLNIVNEHLLDEVKKRNYSLNEIQKISATNIECTKDNNYVYTLWTCYEYIKSLNNNYLKENIFNIFKEIGQYENGWQRYCSEEINYIVPNVTSTAALLYYDKGYNELGDKLFNLLKENQRNGNWDYYIINKGKLIFKTQEDKYHVAMMLYHLYEIKKYKYDEEMIRKTLINFLGNDKDWLQDGSIGWGVPMTLIVYFLYKKEIIGIIGLKRYDNRYNKVYKNTVDYLNHSNFRVRGMSAWVLSKII